MAAKKVKEAKGAGLNESSVKKRAATRAQPSRAVAAARAPRAKVRASPTSTSSPRLLSGGNPQIAKGYGEAPVQAYIAAMPGWKRDAGRRLDALIEQAVPASRGVRKAVKWNSPLYGVADESKGWFLGIHCFDKYIKIAFFRGTSLKPLPPEASKQKEVRYLHIRQDEPLDEAQFSAWVKQASALDGEKM